VTAELAVRRDSVSPTPFRRMHDGVQSRKTPIWGLRRLAEPEAPLRPLVEAVLRDDVWGEGSW